jgi:hypothetical protein
MCKERRQWRVVAFTRPAKEKATPKGGLIFLDDELEQEDSLGTRRRLIIASQAQRLEE